MKNFNILLLITTFIISLSSCKDDDPAPVPVDPTGTVYFRFDNVIDGQPVTYGDLIYINEAGNVYSVDMLKYYISNIVFIKDDNTPVAVSNYELIDESLDTSQYFAVTLPAGNYKSFRFLMGVDSIKNVSGAQAGELDPEGPMEALGIGEGRRQLPALLGLQMEQGRGQGLGLGLGLGPLCGAWGAPPALALSINRAG